MQRFLFAAVLCGLLPLGFSGCAEKETSHSETKITTPGGDTTIKIDRDVKKPADAPPATR
jgi:hypothetical protein